MFSKKKVFVITIILQYRLLIFLMWIMRTNKITNK